ncbi:MAG: response regulator transcription factor [Lachnospiraceae bacterium]|nr:response regulator transcription factor [Lachnospiraceae bacterium]
MRIAICDDQKVYRDDILAHCKRVLPEEGVVYKLFSSGEDFLRADEVYDFLFLDIEMTGIDGIQVKEVMEQQDMQGKIIFLTSHEERMIEAFGSNVIAFLRKPVKYEALRPIVQRMKLFMDRKTVEWEEDGKLYTFYAEEIKYIEVEDKYTYVSVDAERYLVRRSLREWEELLPESDFVLANRSCLINLCLVERVKNEIVLDDGKTIPISRKYKKEIEEKYKEYLRRQMEKL